MRLFLFPLLFATLFPTSPFPPSPAQLLFCHHPWNCFQSCWLLPWAIAVLPHSKKHGLYCLFFLSLVFFFFIFFLTKWAENHFFSPWTRQTSDRSICSPYRISGKETAWTPKNYIPLFNRADSWRNDHIAIAFLNNWRDTARCLCSEWDNIDLETFPIRKKTKTKTSHSGNHYLAISVGTTLTTKMSSNFWAQSCKPVKWDLRSECMWSPGDISRGYHKVSLKGVTRRFRYKIGSELSTAEIWWSWFMHLHALRRVFQTLDCMRF